MSVRLQVTQGSDKDALLTQCSADELPTFSSGIEPGTVSCIIALSSRPLPVAVPEGACSIPMG